MQIQNPYIQYMYSYPHKTAYRTLENMNEKAFLSRLEGHKNSLYFHVPFCQYKCGYCNLFSLAGQPEKMMEEYVVAMECHAQQLSQALPPDVVFSDLTIGGGTPLILPEHLLERIFNIANTYFRFHSKNCPVVVETSPNQTTLSKLRLLKQQGVNRLSIGVQSFKQSELEMLNRFHTVQAVGKALELINQVGFSCVNIDLIYGIPGQTKESLLYSIEQAVGFAPEELFVYPLYIKKGTGLSYQNMHQSEETYELYQFARDVLIEKGYHPVSMRRFVRKENITKDVRSRLCGFGNTISVGCGGRSYLGNLHFCSPYAVKQENCMRIVKEYIEKEDYLQIEYGFILNEEEEKRRYVIKHILFETGVWKQEYREHFGTMVEMDFPLLGKWVQQGYVKDSEERLVLTDKGIALSDYLGPQLISDDVKERMRKWREMDGTELDGTE